MHCDVTKGSILWYSVCRHDKDMWTLFWNCQSNPPEAEAAETRLDWDSLGTSKRTTSFFFSFFGCSLQSTSPYLISFHFLYCPQYPFNFSFSQFSLPTIRFFDLSLTFSALSIPLFFPLCLLSGP